MRLLKERALKLRDHKSPSCNKIAIKMRSKLMGFQSLVPALKILHLASKVFQAETSFSKFSITSFNIH